MCVCEWVLCEVCVCEWVLCEGCVCVCVSGCCVRYVCEWVLCDGPFPPPRMPECLRVDPVRLDQ